MLEVERAEYSGDYTIHLVFNNGKTGTANLEQTIFCDNRSIFSKLKEKSHFRNFQVKNNTVVWFDELDLASEYCFILPLRMILTYRNNSRLGGYVSTVEQDTVDTQAGGIE